MNISTKNNVTTPRISVLLCVYNSEKTLSDAIESILQQTFGNFELIICNDGSTDNSAKVISDYSKKDKRIVYLENKQNMGLSYSLNKCIGMSRGYYCARMDADDLCNPNRLLIEYNFLEQHKKYDFVCTSMKRFDENGYYFEAKEATPYEPTMKDFIKGSPFCHASLVIKKSAYLDVCCYRDIKKTKGVEDYDLWFRLYERAHYGCIIRQPLYYMFDGRDAQKRRTFSRRMNEAWVRNDGYRRIHVPLFKRIYVLKPIILGIIPKAFIKFLRKKRNKNENNCYHCDN